MCAYIIYMYIILKEASQLNSGNANHLLFLAFASKQNNKQ